MKDKEIRKISAIGPGDTYYITLPKRLIKDLKWKKGEKKVISQDGDSVIIEDWKEK